MLQGTFETLTLSEVLGLLARSTKSGALRLEAGPVTGVLHVADGRCVAAESNEERGAVDHAPALLARVVDVCFAVARQEGGSFRFVADEAPEWTCIDAIDLDIALEEVDRLLDEWRDIQLVIGSLDSRVRLSEDLSVEILPVDRERWRLLIAIDGRRTVRDLVQRTSRQVLDVCHALMALSDAGAITIVEPPSAKKNNAAAAASTTTTTAVEKKVIEAPVAPQVVQPEEPYGPGVESDHPGPVAAAPVEGAEKGELLRAFSALQDR